jgi:hypothetical protein
MGSPVIATVAGNWDRRKLLVAGRTGVRRARRGRLPSA